jgi:hypothetical protein
MQPKPLQPGPCKALQGPCTADQKQFSMQHAGGLLPGSELGVNSPRVWTSKELVNSVGVHGPGMSASTDPPRDSTLPEGRWQPSRQSPRRKDHTTRCMLVEQRCHFAARLPHADLSGLQTPITTANWCVIRYKPDEPSRRGPHLQDACKICSKPSLAHGFACANAPRHHELQRRFSCWALVCWTRVVAIL